jgi:hypothetical protein
MYECMNHKKTELWIKIYGLWKLSRAKQSFQERYGGISRILEWLEDLGAKDFGSCEVWEIFEDFCGFFEYLEWVRSFL